jgi:hypothetical protein
MLFTQPHITGVPSPPQCKEVKDMIHESFDDLVFICTLESKRVYDGVHCENKCDGGYGHCGGCKHLVIQEWKDETLVKEYYSDLTPVDHTSEAALNRFMTDNPDFLEIV